MKGREGNGRGWFAKFEVIEDEVASREIQQQPLLGVVDQLLNLIGAVNINCRTRS